MADNLETVKTYIRFLLAQCAAESYLDGLGKLEDQKIKLTGGSDYDGDRIPDGDYYNPETFTGRLALGANHYNAPNGGFELGEYRTSRENGKKWSATMATKEMLRKFADEWTVIDQRANTSSGFSATLLKRKKDGSYTLAFRSTESKSEVDGGDVHRDSSSGANGEIASSGFAWAQIRDMEAYFADLKEGKLDCLGGQVDGDFKDDFNNGHGIHISGYSLGSHLAQVFTRMHSDEVDKTHIVNGAGMGKFDNTDYSSYGSHLILAISDMNSIMADPADSEWISI